jgi:hypothetical protein
MGVVVMGDGDGDQLGSMMFGLAVQKFLNIA